MRIDRFTTKFQQALADAQSLAMQKHHAYLEPVQLLWAMLEDEASGAGSLCARASASAQRLRAEVQTAIDALPEVQGDGAELHISRDLQKLLALTDKDANERGDTYIAGELFLLVLARDKGRIGQLLREAGVQDAALEKAIDELRGGSSVDSPEAEGQREALAKYTTDLTEQARLGKLDPVVGREDEIRRSIQILQRQIG